MRCRARRATSGVQALGPPRSGRGAGGWTRTPDRWGPRRVTRRLGRGSGGRPSVRDRGAGHDDDGLRGLCQGPGLVHRASCGGDGRGEVSAIVHDGTLSGDVPPRYPLLTPSSVQSGCLQHPHPHLVRAGAVDALLRHSDPLPAPQPLLEPVDGPGLARGQRGVGREQVGRPGAGAVQDVLLLGVDVESSRPCWSRRRSRAARRGGWSHRRGRRRGRRAGRCGRCPSASPPAKRSR